MSDTKTIKIKGKTYELTKFKDPHIYKCQGVVIPCPRPWNCVGCKEIIVLYCTPEDTEEEKVTVNENGGKQHLIEARYDLFPAKVNQDVASVLYKGALDYGEWNWTKIPMVDHINHAMAHLENALAQYQDNQQVDYEDLTHAICRCLFAAHMSKINE